MTGEEARLEEAVRGVIEQYDRGALSADREAAAEAVERLREAFWWWESQRTDPSKTG